MTEPLDRLNVSITGEEAELLKRLQIHFNEKLMMKLSIPQIVKRLIKQTANTELK
jgi:hypothetical protein